MCAVMCVIKIDAPLSHSLSQVIVCCCKADVSQLLLPSDCDMTGGVWMAVGRGCAPHFVCALIKSIHTSLHSYLHHLPACICLASLASCHNMLLLPTSPLSSQSTKRGA